MSRRYGLGGPKHPFNERKAGDAVQHLGHLRLHARALARCEHYDVNVIHAQF